MTMSCRILCMFNHPKRVVSKTNSVNCNCSVRGVINIMGFLMTSLGNLIEFVIAMFMDFRMQAVCALSIPLIFVLSFSFVPESPEFLYKKHKVEVNSPESDTNFARISKTNFYCKKLGNAALEFYKGSNASLESEKYATDAKFCSKRSSFSDCGK